jgi:multidrug efflux pump subunit AcrA (membrane-fusion protein)
MYATLRFTAASPRGIVSVPRSAVLSTGERSLVFKRLADGRLEPHQVRLGLASDERVQVLEGISAGDTVVASGTFLVDAESNLGTAMGGMGDMPGMVMAPVVPLDSVPPKPAHTDHAR